jgi:glycosyltransferase involved in cell wall biosynthesis
LIKKDIISNFIILKKFNSYITMKIAQISPLYESVPPKFYGGTERVVHFLTEELVSLGHDVTLFASGDSVSSARLVPCSENALRLDKSCVDQFAPHFTMIELIEREAKNFDIIHSHIDYTYFPVMKRSKNLYLTTLHGRLDLPEHFPLYRQYNDIPLISISNSQRRPIAFANWQATIYHGLPEKLFKFIGTPGQYLAFVGRISPEKRVDRAIEIAIKTGVPIRIAAKVSDVDMEYFEKEIEPLFDHPLVEFIGEIGDSEKQDLLGNALALLYLIDWPEPFGLAMIEAMACGTPVIAYGHGSVPEVVDHGVTGYIVHSQQDAIDAVNKLSRIDRKKCRAVFEQRFSSRRMAKDYLSVYHSILQNSMTKKKSHFLNKSFNDNSIYGTGALE